MNGLPLRAAGLAFGAAVWAATAGLPVTAGASEPPGALRDPMRPPAAMRASLPGADAGLPPAERKPAPRELDRLVAIRNDGARGWQALLGERWLAVGDRIDRYTVSDIAANSVLLAEGRNRRTLTLLPLLQPGATLTAAEPAGAAPGAKPLPRSPERNTP